MKIACLGGGPAGVYLAISMKLRDSKHDITVYERHKSGDTFGWGVVFSDQTMDNLRLNDPVSAQALIDELVLWDRVGSCPDNSYEVQLFREDLDHLLCETHDSMDKVYILVLFLDALYWLNKQVEVLLV